MSRSQAPASRTPGSPRGSRPRVAAAIGALALVILTGCASTSSSDTSSAGSAALPAGSKEGLAGGGSQYAMDSAGQSADSGAQAASGSAAPLTARRQIRSGALTVAVPDVADTIITVRRIATTAKGFVADEQTTTTVRPEPVPLGPEPASGRTATPGGATAGQSDAVIVNRSVLTVRVPEQSLEQVMDQVAGVGTLRARSQAAQDVTDTYVDTATRLRTQRESVARVQALLSKATTIGDIVKVEGELSRRQADLESLEARLAALDDSTTLATLTVELIPDEAAVRAAAAPREGFVGGLQSGWHALTVTVVTGSHVVGAVLPFLVPVGILAVPVIMTLRRRRTRTPEPAA